MAGAGRELEQRGVDSAQVLDLEDLGGEIGAVLGEAAVHGDAISVEVLAQQQLAAAAVEALVAQLAVVGGDTVANLEALDILADGRNDANCLVARYQGELGDELALVDVLSASVSGGSQLRGTCLISQISAANTASLDLHQDIVVSQRRQRDLDDGPVLGLLISESLHLLGKGRHLNISLTRARRKQRLLRTTKGGRWQVGSRTGSTIRGPRHSSYSTRQDCSQLGVAMDPWARAEFSGPQHGPEHGRYLHSSRGHVLRATADVARPDPAAG